MIRIFFASVGMALVIGLIFSPAAIVPAFVILFFLIAVANLGKLKCPYCGKRVKLGKNVCHHCGREVKSLRQKSLRRQLEFVLSQSSYLNHIKEPLSIVQVAELRSTLQPASVHNAGELSNECTPESRSFSSTECDSAD